MSNKTAVVILNWNGVAFLEQFLAQVIGCSNQADVILADNQSTDNSLEYVTTHFPDLRIIVNATNGGYAKGYNDALSQLEGAYEYYVLLNSDVEVTPNWLAPLIDQLDSDATLSGVQPKILAHHNKQQFEHAGAAGGFIDTNYYPFCRGRIFDTVENDCGQYNHVQEVFWVSGAAMLIRAKDFHEVQGFDEDFFAHMEEIDWCWRLKLQGKRFLVEPKSTVYHVGGGTLNYQSPRKTYLNFRNSLMMIYKNHPGFVWGKIFTRLILDGVAGCMFLITMQPKHTQAILKAHLGFYRQLSSLKIKRKVTQSNVSNYNRQGIFRGSILYNYHLKRTRTFDRLNKRLFEGS